MPAVPFARFRSADSALRQITQQCRCITIL